MYSYIRTIFISSLIQMWKNYALNYFTGTFSSYMHLVNSHSYHKFQVEIGAVHRFMVLNFVLRDDYPSAAAI